VVCRAIWEDRKRQRASISRKLWKKRDQHGHEGKVLAELVKRLVAGAIPTPAAEVPLHPVNGGSIQLHCYWIVTVMSVQAMTLRVPLAALPGRSLGRVRNG